MSASAVQLTSSDSTIAAIERGFAAHVAERYNGRILRYSQRMEMLKAAQRLRINRFRANLIIAMVQHQSGVRPAVAESEEKHHRSVFRMGPIIAGVFLAELATVAGVWLLMRS